MFLFCKEFQDDIIKSKVHLSVTSQQVPTQLDWLKLLCLLECASHFVCVINCTLGHNQSTAHLCCIYFIVNCLVSQWEWC